MRPVAKRIDIRHQLIPQLQILLKNRLRLLAIRPDLVMKSASVAPEVRLECPILKPPYIQLWIIVIVPHIIPGSDGSSSGGCSGVCDPGRYCHPQFRAPVRHSRRRKVDPSAPAASTYPSSERYPTTRRSRHYAARPNKHLAKESAHASSNPAETRYKRSRMEQRIHIEKLCPRPDIKEASIRRKIRLSLVRPEKSKPLFTKFSFTVFQYQQPHQDSSYRCPIRHDRTAVHSSACHPPDA